MSFRAKVIVAMPHRRMRTWLRSCANPKSGSQIWWSDDPLLW